MSLRPTLGPMLASARFINRFIRPGDLSAAEIQRALTFAGFPIESAEELTGAMTGDMRLDVELTSNRGDCFSHVGLAREVAAVTHRTFAPPTPVLPAAAGTDVHQHVTLENTDTAACPLFSLVLISGVKVGPSPEWLRQALEACGQRSINNIVDVTNYVLLELGHPSHAFDMARLAAISAGDGRKAIVVRASKAGEKLTLLDGRVVDLKPSDMVVADSAGPKSLAGVMGGAESGVSASTTDVLLEVATWDPIKVRTASRRLNLRTDASYRYERWVPPETSAFARDRLVELIIQVAGGAVHPGVLASGRTLAEPCRINLRLSRLASISGTAFTSNQATSALRAQGFEVRALNADELAVTVPHARHDVRLEIDLIEEVIRTVGLEKIPQLDRLPIATKPVQGDEAAMAELCRVLTGCGMFEAVSFSFTSAKKARPFTHGSVATAQVNEERRGSENVLRPSALIGLLDVRRVNQDGKVRQPGGVRLFELASAFSQSKTADAATGLPPSLEAPKLVLLIDLPERGPNTGSGGGTGVLERRQAGVSLMRGIIEQAVAATLGPAALVRCVPQMTPGIAALDASACAEVHVNGKHAGQMGIIAAEVQKLFELEAPVVIAELDVLPLLSNWPPKAMAHELPTFPATDRDVSLIVGETVLWDDIADTIEHARPAQLETFRFVTTYRGKPLEAGKKSVTFRMTFRDAAKTLTDDAVNPQVDALVETLVGKLGAVVRQG